MTIFTKFTYPVSIALLVIIHSLHAHGAPPPLTTSFYARTCPSVFNIVKSGVSSAVQNDARMAASLLRLHFHDCFVNGCDGSVLLDDTPTMAGEKNARPNRNSIRGFEVVDSIKSQVELACPGVVSCADILAIAARDAVVQVQGPTWDVKLGRRDSQSASQSAANSALPSPFEPLPAIVAKFAAVGLSAQDVASLSGGHSIGRARCSIVAPRLYNFNGTGQPDPTLSASYLQLLRAFCGPQSTASTSSALLDLDLSTPGTFDNKYFQNLGSSEGLLGSDQVLATPDSATFGFVNAFAANQRAFFVAFARSMVKMGDISPLVAPNGQIRTNCRVVNA